MTKITKLLTVSDATTAYNWETGFDVARIDVLNITEFATDSKLAESWWYRGMADGYYGGMENLATVATNGRKPVLGTTLGFTPYDTGTFAVKKLTINTNSTAVSKATNAVVKLTAHGMATGDKVTFMSVLLGMTELNGLTTEITKIDADSFSCDSIDSTGFTAWNVLEVGGQVLKTSETNQNDGFLGITIGTDILSTNANVLLLTAYDDFSLESITQ